MQIKIQSRHLVAIQKPPQSMSSRWNVLWQEQVPAIVLVGTRDIRTRDGVEAAIFQMSKTSRNAPSNPPGDTFGPGLVDSMEKAGRVGKAGRAVEQYQKQGLSLQQGCFLPSVRYSAHLPLLQQRVDRPGGKTQIVLVEWSQCVVCCIIHPPAFLTNFRRDSKGRPSS